MNETNKNLIISIVSFIGKLMETILLEIVPLVTILFFLFYHIDKMDVSRDSKIFLYYCSLLTTLSVTLTFAKIHDYIKAIFAYVENTDRSFTYFIKCVNEFQKSAKNDTCNQSNEPEK